MKTLDILSLITIILTIKLIISRKREIGRIEQLEKDLNKRGE